MRLIRAGELPHVTLAVADGSFASQPRHAHDSLVLGVVLAGARRIDTTGGSTLVPQGAVFALAPGVAHACAPDHSADTFDDTSDDTFNDKSDAKTVPADACEPARTGACGESCGRNSDAISNTNSDVIFNDNSNDKPAAKEPACSYLALSIGPAALPPDIRRLRLGSPRLDDPALAEAVRRLAEALRAPAGELERQSLLAECLELLAAHGPGPAKDESEAAPELVRAAQRLLEENLEAGLDLAALAKACGAGAFALHRAFTRVVGLPPHAYQTHLRLRRAKELLRAGAELSEAALASGFCDQAHMTRHFSRSVGISPAQYARAHRDGKD